MSFNLQMTSVQWPAAQANIGTRKENICRFNQQVKQEPVSDNYAPRLNKKEKD